VKGEKGPADSVRCTLISILLQIGFRQDESGRGGGYQKKTKTK